MKNLLFGITLIVVGFLFSCRKDSNVSPPSKVYDGEDLVGDKAIFVGEWEWYQTEHKWGWCTVGTTMYDTINTQTTNNIYNMRFIEDGTIEFYKNGNLINSYAIFFHHFYLENQGACDLSNSFHFGILLDSSLTNNLSGCINSDSIHCTSDYFPFEYEDPACESYWSDFKKQ